MTNESYRPISHPILFYIHFPPFASRPPSLTSSPTHSLTHSPSHPLSSLSFSSHSFSILSPQQPSCLSCSPLCLLSPSEYSLISKYSTPSTHEPAIPSAPTISACSPLRLLSCPRKEKRVLQVTEDEIVIDYGCMARKA